MCVGGQECGASLCRCCFHVWESPQLFPACFSIFSLPLHAPSPYGSHMYVLAEGTATDLLATTTQTQSQDACQPLS